MLSEAVREKIRSFLPRYDQPRAALLPALHVTQDALGHIPWKAMVEIAELLGIHPSDVMDTISFYTHFWTHPKGDKVLTVCRSITCELMGGAAVIERIKEHLGIDEHGTTADGQYSLQTEECLAGCDHAPCMLINERLHKRIRPEDVAKILADPGNDRIDVRRSDLFDAPPADAQSASASATHERVETGEVLESTSDVREMRESNG
jgi:NADH-quinone oxidoreductase subunit E